MQNTDSWAQVTALCPERSVERPILDSFRDMLGCDWADPVEVGDSSGHFQDAVVGAGGESLLGHRALQQALTVGGEFAEGSNVAWGHLRIAIEFGIGSF